jgi:hypothetical protein
MIILNNSKLARKLLAFAKNQSKTSQSMMTVSHQLTKDMRKDSSASMKAVRSLAAGNSA